MAKIQLLLLLTVVTFAIISSVQSVPVKDSSEAKSNSEKCQTLCGFCGCTGYYCGDECLCECNSRTDGEAECVDTMKSNCKKLELPFEVLIQGPNVNRMVRSLLYAGPEEEQTCAKSSETHQTKRSTISIYKPDAMNQQDEILSAPSHQFKSDASSRMPMDSKPVQVVVAEKSSAPEVTPSKVEPASDDNVKDNPTVASNSNIKLSSSEDDIDRVNIKRHIIDVNQDIADFDSIIDTDDSPLYKRNTEVAAPVPEVVAAPAPDEVALAAPASFILPKVVTKIPSNEEIVAAWEGVRSAFNKNINDVIDSAKTRADTLRDDFKIDPLKWDDDLGTALLAGIIPAAAAAKAAIIPFKLAELPIKAGLKVGAAAIKLPIKAEIIKNIAALKLNDHLIKDAGRILHLEHKMLFPLLHAVTDEKLGSPPEEVAAPAPETV